MTNETWGRKRPLSTIPKLAKLVRSPPRHWDTHSSLTSTYEWWHCDGYCVIKKRRWARITLSDWSKSVLATIGMGFYYIMKTWWVMIQWSMTYRWQEYDTTWQQQKIIIAQCWLTEMRRYYYECHMKIKGDMDILYMFNGQGGGKVDLRQKPIWVRWNRTVDGPNHHYYFGSTKQVRPRLRQAKTNWLTYDLQWYLW